MRVKLRSLFAKLSLEFELLFRLCSNDIRLLRECRASGPFRAGAAVMALGRRLPISSLSIAMSIVAEDSRGELTSWKGGGGGGGGVFLRCWSSGRIGGGGGGGGGGGMESVFGADACCCCCIACSIVSSMLTVIWGDVPEM